VLGVTQEHMGERERLLDHVIEDMYAAISFAEGDEPDWETMREVFLPNARLTRVTPDGISHYDLDAFQDMARNMLDLGVYTAFHECEVARKVDLFGSVAHVLSAYETKRSPTAVQPLARGINSIQLLWTGTRWAVLSLFWDEEDSRGAFDMAACFGDHHGQGS
jgi:hypothetical protein